MSEPKWTPGPWRFDYGDSFDHGEDGEANGFEILLGAANPRVNGRCRSIDRIRYAEDIFPEDNERAEAEANARLIAAAPDLAAQLEDARITLEEAAKLLARDYPSVANNLVNQCAIRCGDALAKARGEREKP